MRSPKSSLLRFSFISAVFLIIFILSYFRLFNHYDLISYDLRFKLRPPLRASQDIIIIQISDDSLKNLGEWPLPRDFHASLIEVLREYGAKAIVFDILFSEPTLYDEIFSQKIKEAGNVYLPLALYLDEGLKKDYLPAEGDKIIADINSIFARFATIGHINVFVDPDGKIRRIPLFVKYKERLFPSLGLKVACDSLGLDTRNVEFKRDKVIIDRKISLPVAFNTTFMVNYPGKWDRAFQHLSYLEILKSYADIKNAKPPKLDLSVIKDKVCFIGLTATGTTDLKPTPLENIYPMLGLHASIFNSVVSKNFIKDMGAPCNTLINIFILILSLIICLRFSPTRSLLGTIILGLFYFVISVGLFIFYGIWIDLFFPILLIGFTYVGATSYRFLKEIRKRRLLEKELDIARGIQKSFLPRDIKGFSGLAIASFMQPAKFVAGDFYDIIELDNRRIGILIGDVSGKGVPASLIMAQTISLFRIFSRQYLLPSEVLASLNKELCGKFAGRFVTCLYMIVDTDSSRILVSSAGHEPLFSCNKEADKISEVTLPTGLPLGIVNDVEYNETKFDIEDNDRVIVFTDGLFEARNRNNQEFGLQRLKDVILENANLPPQEMLEALKKKISAFSYHHPQHDDITLVNLANQ